MSSSRPGERPSGLAETVGRRVRAAMSGVVWDGTKDESHVRSVEFLVLAKMLFKWASGLRKPSRDI